MKILTIVLLVIISGCGKESAKISENIPEKNASESSNETKDNGTLKHESGETNDENKSGIGYVQYSISKLPEEIKYNGSVVAMAKWKDSRGENIVFVTETAENSHEDDRSKELFGYQYLITDKGTSQLWRINDFVKDCPVDLTLNYIDKSLEITDLDSNGIAESSFLYRMSCKGDVSPDDMKLIMHEGKDKYALRGIMEMKLNGKPYQEGDMSIDPSYKNAPGSFLIYSESKWNKYKVDNIGN